MGHCDSSQSGGRTRDGPCRARHPMAIPPMLGRAGGGLAYQARGIGLGD